MSLPLQMSLYEAPDRMRLRLRKAIERTFDWQILSGRVKLAMHPI